ncbi:phosphopantetheine-binding protein [Microbulbifer sp. A4B17]|uniref:phosphopantetheine-binding protein n=1 Tax=Microbulbifer sp. A4B17 TaxID=359370 RepID=UPI003512F958
MLVGRHAGLLVSAETLSFSDNLYDAGMNSLASVTLLLSLEESFNVFFPDTMLNQETFQNLGSICNAISNLRRDTL